MRGSYWMMLVAVGTAVVGPGSPAQNRSGDPAAGVAPVTDDHFGTRITDPYR